MHVHRIVTIVGGIMTLTAAAAGALVVGDRSLTASPGVRHATLHLNCPPGSHGKPRFARFGASLGHKAPTPEGPAHPLAARSLTAPRPER
jgi:hypothetical protein